MSDASGPTLEEEFAILEEDLSLVREERDGLKSVLYKLIEMKPELAKYLESDNSPLVLGVSSNGETVVSVNDFELLAMENEILQEDVKKKTKRLAASRINELANVELETLMEINLALRDNTPLVRQETEQSKQTLRIVRRPSLITMHKMEKCRSVQNLSALNVDVRSPSLIRMSKIEEKDLMGGIQFPDERIDEVIKCLITDNQPLTLQNEIPGVTAHILFMILRNYDATKDAERMKAFLMLTTDAIQEKVKTDSCDVDVLVFWITNCCKLISNIKIYSSEDKFKENTFGRLLTNFDLSGHCKIFSELILQTYRLLLQLFANDLGPIASSSFFENNMIDEDVSSKDPLSPGLAHTPLSVQDFFEWVLNLLGDHRVEPELSMQTVDDLVGFVSKYCLNELLLRRDLIKPDIGLSLCYNVQQLQEWLRSKGYGQFINHFDKLLQAGTLIQACQSSSQHLIDICLESTELSVQQIHRLLIMILIENNYDAQENPDIVLEDSLTELQVHQTIQKILSKKRHKNNINVSTTNLTLSNNHANDKIPENEETTTSSPATTVSHSSASDPKTLSSTFLGETDLQKAKLAVPVTPHNIRFEQLNIPVVFQLNFLKIV